MVTKLSQLYEDMKEAQQTYTRCCVCESRAYQTYWRSEKGLDPSLREYLCLWGHTTYRVDKTLVELLKKGAL